MKRNEFVNWRSHPTLNEVTKMCIDYYEHNYNFDDYLDERAKKDTKFVNPLDKIEEEKIKMGGEEEDQEGAEKEKDKDGNGSEFSFSEEENEEMSNDIAG
jgi:nitrate reductase beta subunit